VAKSLGFFQYKRFRAGHCERLILIWLAAAHADCSDDGFPDLKWNAARNIGYATLSADLNSIGRITNSGKDGYASWSWRTKNPADADAT
jgi:hypothetical protein